MGCTHQGARRETTKLVVTGAQVPALWGQQAGAETEQSPQVRKFLWLPSPESTFMCTAVQATKKETSAVATITPKSLLVPPCSQ